MLMTYMPVTLRKSKLTAPATKFRGGTCIGRYAYPIGPNVAKIRPENRRVG